MSSALSVFATLVVVLELAYLALRKRNVIYFLKAEEAPYVRSRSAAHAVAVLGSLSPYSIMHTTVAVGWKINF